MQKSKLEQGILVKDIMPNPAFDSKELLVEPPFVSMCLMVHLWIQQAG
jgi:hypothetical protein